MSAHSYDYSQKYLKYKTKYLELQSKLNNQSGGNSKTARNSFFNKVFKNKDMIYGLLKSDTYLIVKLTSKSIELPSEIETDVEALKTNPVLNEIFDIIVDGVDDKIIDEYVKIYLNGKLGGPNSIENIGRYKDAHVELEKLKNNIQALKIEIPATFDSLTDLEDFITKNKSNLDLINQKIKSTQSIVNTHKQIKTEGEQDVEIILDTPKVIIYHPTTEAGAKYYGRETKWCTAATNNNMFSYYNNEGTLYIIIPKSDQKNKFQIHFEHTQLMDATDKPVTPEYVIELLNDEQFINWFNKKIGLDKGLLTGDITIRTWLPYFKEEHNSKIKKLRFANGFNEPLGNYLDKFVNLQELNLGDSFNQPLAKCFDNCTSLQVLTFGIDFNQPLAKSFDNLINLRVLNFGENFNQDLKYSLINLVNLQELNFGWAFNQDINSLYAQTKLQVLTFGHNFNKGLYYSLDYLPNLKVLKFGNNFNNENKPIGDSFEKLVNLQELVFGKEFNQMIYLAIKNLDISILTLPFDYKHTIPYKPNLKIIKV